MNATPLAVLLAGGAVVTSSVLVAVSTTPSKAPDPTFGGGDSGAVSTAPQAANGKQDSNPGHPISLSGVVTGQVSPGRPATLTVTVSNPNNQDLVVTSLSGSVTSVTSQRIPGRPGCDAAWFSVGTFLGTKAIAAKKSGQIAVPVTLADLPDTNQDSCKGSTLQLAFTAQARQA